MRPVYCGHHANGGSGAPGTVMVIMCRFEAGHDGLHIDHEGFRFWATGEKTGKNTCANCHEGIEWFNKSWWMTGTCGSVCGDLGDHVPATRYTGPDSAREDEPADPPQRGRVRSEAARRVFG